MNTLETMLREGYMFSNRRGKVVFDANSTKEQRFAAEIENARNNADISTVLTVFKAYGIREGITPEEHAAEVKAKHFEEFKQLYLEKHNG